MTHEIVTVMQVHLRDSMATLASAGVIYAFAIAAKPRLTQPEWEAINTAISKRFAPEHEGGFCDKVDKVKRHAWRLHDAVVAEKGAFNETHP